MLTILVIGSTGMLGSAVTQFLTSAKNNLNVIESNTSGRPLISSNICIKFDITKNTVEDLFRLVSVHIDFIINCSGVIKHKIDESDLACIDNVEKINSIFPRDLAFVGITKSTRIIHIATDCVYSGRDGLYAEDSIHDAVDIYGKSKSEGEVNFENAMFLRCSIIGRELRSHVSFMDWILEQPRNSHLNGYMDHLWNGITTFHFAKIVLGILSNNSFQSGKHHVLPSDSASKFEMIQMITKNFAREDIQIEKVLAEMPIDRRLATKFPDMNRELWLNAGYDSPPNIQQMIAEYANWMRSR